MRALAVGLAQTLPLALGLVALPPLLLLRGATLEEIDALAWLALPVLAAALWASQIDRMRAVRGERRTLVGLLALELGVLAALVLLLARFTGSPALLQALLVATAAVGATVGLAHGATLVTARSSAERGGSVAAMHAGAYLAVAACSAAPWLRTRADERVVLLTLGALALPALLLSLLGGSSAARDADGQSPEPQRRETRADAPLAEGQPQIGRAAWAAILALAGLAGGALIGPIVARVADAGEPLAQIISRAALVVGGAGAGGALLTALLVRLTSLSRALGVLGLLCTLAPLPLIMMLARGRDDPYAVTAVIVAVASAAGYAAALGEAAVARCRAEQAAADFAWQQRLLAAGALLGAVAGAVLARRFGYAVALAIAPGAAVSALILRRAARAEREAS